MEARNGNYCNFHNDFHNAVITWFSPTKFMLLIAEIIIMVISLLLLMTAPASCDFSLSIHFFRQCVMYFAYFVYTLNIVEIHEDDFMFLGSLKQMYIFKVSQNIFIMPKAKCLILR